MTRPFLYSPECKSLFSCVTFREDFARPTLTRTTVVAASAISVLTFAVDLIIRSFMFSDVP